MPNLRSFLSRRRLLAVIGIAALLFGLAMVHPYPRQSLFGPTIRGKPWCVWEAEVRRLTQENGEENWLFARLMGWLGVKQGPLERKELFDDAEMMPVVLHLLDDPDPKIRREALRAFRKYPCLRSETALPAIYGRLNDDDGDSRVWAAAAIWLFTKEKKVIHVLLHEMADEVNGSEHPFHGRHLAGHMMRNSDMCNEAPEIFPQLAKHVHDKNEFVRHSVMGMMKKFGIQGVPILIEGLSDPSSYVRGEAARSLGGLGADAKEAVSALVKVMDKPVDNNDLPNNPVIDALIAIDPGRFEHLRAKAK